jgi:hypothetical protein
MALVLDAGLSRRPNQFVWQLWARSHGAARPESNTARFHELLRGAQAIQQSGGGEHTSRSDIPAGGPLD